ncbi:hypothetical protein ACJJTC_010469 [Scirpophaga incertulas]
MNSSVELRQKCSETDPQRRRLQPPQHQHLARAALVAERCSDSPAAAPRAGRGRRRSARARRARRAPSGARAAPPAAAPAPAPRTSRQASQRAGAACAAGAQRCAGGAACSRPSTSTSHVPRLWRRGAVTHPQRRPEQVAAGVAARGRGVRGGRPAVRGRRRLQPPQHQHLARAALVAERCSDSPAAAPRAGRGRRRSARARRARRAPSGARAAPPAAAPAPAPRTSRQASQRAGAACAAGAQRCAGGAACSRPSTSTSHVPRLWRRGAVTHPQRRPEQVAAGVAARGRGVRGGRPAVRGRRRLQPPQHQHLARAALVAERCSDSPAAAPRAGRGRRRSARARRARRAPSGARAAPPAAAPAPAPRTSRQASQRAGAACAAGAQRCAGGAACSRPSTSTSHVPRLWRRGAVTHPQRRPEQVAAGVAARGRGVRGGRPAVRGRRRLQPPQHQHLARAALVAERCSDSPAAAPRAGRGRRRSARARRARRAPSGARAAPPAAAPAPAPRTCRACGGEVQ